MELVYTKRFNKDLDAIQHNKEIRKGLLELIETLKQASSLAELREVRKIKGYADYYRIKLGEYRLGMKLTKSSIELIRFLHRKEIHRRFP